MKIKNLYKNGSAVGLNPEGENQEIHGFRLMAEDGYLLKNGETVTPCVDVGVDDVDNWEEIEDHTMDEEELTDEEALEIITGE